MDITTSRIAATLEMLGISAQNWCLLAGISPAKWSRAINPDRPGGVPLTGNELLCLAKIAEDLKEIAGGSDPLPIDFRNVEAIGRVLALLQSGVKMTVHAEPAEKVGPVEVEK